MSADASAFERELRHEGFRHVYVWSDAANAFYSDHVHPVDTSLIVLDG